MLSAQALLDQAEQLLRGLSARGFDQAQVKLIHTLRSEVCIAHNEPSLLRSNDSFALHIEGLLDGRRASAETSSPDAVHWAQTIQSLWDSVQSAPQDDANQLSSGQVALVQRGLKTLAAGAGAGSGAGAGAGVGASASAGAGSSAGTGAGKDPVAGPASSSDEAPDSDHDIAALADAMASLLTWRQQQAPSAMLEDALAGHTHQRTCFVSSGGSQLQSDLAWFDASVFALAREGGRSSSFNSAGGECGSLGDLCFEQLFGTAQMLQDLTRQVHTEPLGAPFVGSVVLTPRALAPLLSWLLGQLADQALIDGSSVYLKQVGQRVAARGLSLRSRFEAPGVPPFTADGFLPTPLSLVEKGVLQHLTPSLYGSRKTALPHVPVVHGWSVDAGISPWQTLVAQVRQGALVDRLSMGRPAPNGDFSGVVKNSFAVRDGQLGPALQETMISGNVAQMLRDISGLSRERIDTGSWLLPWAVVPGLHFS